MGDKVVSPSEAAALVRSGDTICTSGFVGIGVPEELLQALEQRFLDTKEPRDLTLIFAAGQGDGKDRGLNRLGIKRSGLADQSDGAALKELQQLWKLLYRSGLPFSEALHQAVSTAGTEPGRKLVSFLEASCMNERRGPLPAQRS